ncbi:unnamed protein product [Orchesella dallaii]|uniref:Uncharacterized protein n=1 Tax=Orchesella dallaii TaxID=48710 RepID=A0ABP1R162_9HEXA
MRSAIIQVALLVYSGLAISTATKSSHGLEETRVKKNANRKIQSTLSFVMKPLGLIECQGANAEMAGNFFEQILGKDINYNSSDYICGPTCKGSCIPRPADIGIPPSSYPFGCNCTLPGCDANGPIVAPMARPYFKLACKRDTRCSCFGMGPGRFTGYSCQWINTISGSPITYAENSSTLPGSLGRPPVHRPSRFPNFFPIRYCSCCMH